MTYSFIPLDTLGCLVGGVVLLLSYLFKHLHTLPVNKQCVMVHPSVSITVATRRGPPLPVLGVPAQRTELRHSHLVVFILSVPSLFGYTKPVEQGTK